MLTIAALTLAGCAGPAVMSGSSENVTVASQAFSPDRVAKAAADHCAKYGKQPQYYGSDHIATTFLCR